jgi:hypothetical protein
MSIVGILAWRSALNDSEPLEVPDFRHEEARLKYENDHWTPDPARSNTPDMVAPSALRPVVKSAEAKALAKKVWGEQGYDVDVEEGVKVEAAEVVH